MRVLVREPIAEAGVALLRERFDVDVDPDTPLEEVIDRYDGIVIRSATRLTRDLIDRATQLKVIGRAGVGVDNVDVEAATRQGIVVANAPESNVVSAAEHTIGLLVALARNIPQAHAALKQGRWERSRWGGIELAGKTLGVLGFGRIGQQVARRAIGLGMRVVGYDPFVGDDRFREVGVERLPGLDDVLGAADFVTLHLPLTDETTGIIGTDAIAKMRDGARLVNAARGALVDEDALVEAIRSGKLAGAALDVFSAEPYMGPLLELDEVVVTPHLAASTDEAQDRAGLIIAEQVVAALEGGLVTNAVTIRVAVAAHGPLSEYDTRLLTVAALNGVFQGRVDQAVNYVNAPVIAAERGIEVAEERFNASRDYMNVVEVRTDGVAVSGTTIGPEPRLFLARALGFAIDLELAPNLVFLLYTDMPGVIGRVGTVFGEHGVNIANMAVSRTHEAGKALMAFAIDAPAPPELLELIHAEGFDDAWFISLA